MSADYKITKLTKSAHREAAAIKNAQRHVFEAEIPAQSAFLNKITAAARRARSIERRAQRHQEIDHDMDGWS